MKAWLAVAAFAMIALAPIRLVAQPAAPDIHVGVETDTVAVGEAVVVELQASSDTTLPSSPTIGPTPGFTLRGQSASPSQTHMNINGQQSDNYTLIAQFTLLAQRVGTYQVGPAGVTIGTTRYTAPPLTLHVVAQGKAPPRRPRPTPFDPFGGFSPFDPWRQLFPGFGGGGRPVPDLPQAQVTPTLDPKLAVDPPRGSMYFLHAAVDKTSAVVGEAVILSVYVYIDAAAAEAEFDPDDVHEPTVADFAKESLIREDQDAPVVGYAQSGGRVWRVRLVRRFALFPLHAGDLPIGPMKLGFMRPRQLAGQTRSTETLAVHVVDPPLAGRPPGYALGDVGRFAIAAEVSPRQIDQDGAVGVHVELSGSGNMPSALKVPIREQVEWLPPEVHDALGPIGQDAYGGKRTFDFVVRIHRTGDVPLGELTLPYWDPERRRYEVVRAALGSVAVKPTPGAAAAGATAHPEAEVLAGLPSVRATLEGESKPGRHFDDSPLFWLLGIAGAPLTFGIAVASRAAGRRVAQKLDERRSSPRAELRAKIARARREAHGTDPRAIDAATSRALEAAALAHAGVRVRGAVGAEVVTRLVSGGLSPEAAARVAELLRACESARFSPDAEDLERARSRFVQASDAIAAMGLRG